MGTASLFPCVLSRQGKDPCKDMLILAKAVLDSFPCESLGAEKIRSASLGRDGDTCSEWTWLTCNPGLKEMQVSKLARSPEETKSGMAHVAGKE